jgi:hypothetical protein
MQPINKLYILLFLFFISIHTRAQTAYFSDSTQISLLVSSPGSELYTAFGHSAIRVTDYKRGLDWVFNYGVFDFDTPNFYGKFVRGKLLYKLAIQEFPSYWTSYTGSQQLVTEQVLQLEPAQKQYFLSRLMDNYKPENRYYLYDFFYDNCATRIRDIIEAAADGRLVIPEPATTEGPAFRDLLHYHVGTRYWTSFGIDIILGLEADKVADFRDQMFLPEFLSRNLGEYQFKKDGSLEKVLSEPVVLMEKGPEPPRLNWFLRPVFVMSLICLVLLMLSIRFNKKQKRRLDRILFTVLGLCGFFLLFMWFGTDHIATERNMNLVWLNPLYLLFAFGLHKPKHGLHKVLKWILFMGTFLVLVNFMWWPQYIHPAFLPVIGLSMVRVVDYIRIRGQAGGAV